MQKHSFIKNCLPISFDNLEINLFNEKDVNLDYISWLNDKTLMQFSNQRFEEHTIKSSLNYLEKMKKTDAVFLSICASATTELIGTMTVYFDKNHGTADIGILVGNKKFRKTGVAKQSWKLIIEALKKNNIRKITSGTLECNLPMIKIIEKAEMKPDGIKIAQEIVNGKPFNMRYFAIFN